jgi:hypothetical protein
MSLYTLAAIYFLNTYTWHSRVTRELGLENFSRLVVDTSLVIQNFKLVRIETLQSI